MPRDIVTVHLRLTRSEHEDLKRKKGTKSWEEYFLELAGADNHELD